MKPLRLHRTSRALSLLGLLLAAAVAWGLAVPARAQEVAGALPGPGQALAGVASLAQTADRAEVLVLHSYHQGYKWTDDINDGILSVLEGPGAAELPGGRIDVQIEYMDTKRIYDEAYVQYLYETYKYKFRDRHFGAIISSDDNAFSFLLQYGDEIWPGTPVVFSGVNYFDPSMLDAAASSAHLFTGVNEESDIRSGLELALRLHPETGIVAIVNDMTTTGRKVHEQLMEVLPDFEDRVVFVFLEAVDMQDIQDTIRSLPANSLVYYTLFLRDNSGVFWEYDESITEVVEAASDVRGGSIPVYGTWDFSLGYGIVGGMLTSGFYQGETAARLALRILQGEPVEEIPVVMDSPNRYMFDYEQLQRFGISLDSLPEDSVVLNRPVSFFERYRTWILGGGGTLVALVGVILVLGSVTIRRRRAEEALRTSNVELREIRSSLEQRVAERTQALDQRSAALEAAAEVAREAAAIRDVNLLLEETVHLISERMGFYHAGIFLIDEAGRYAVLRAASSEGGKRMLDRGHQLPVGTASALGASRPGAGSGAGRGIVGFVAGSGRPRIALDVGQDAVFFDNPDLPDTRSEMALPLRIRGRVVGVLDVQSTAAGAFSAEDVTILQTLADQVALALENARLLQEMQDRLREISTLAAEQDRRRWRDLEEAGLALPELAGAGLARSYLYDGVDVVPRAVGQPPARQASEVTVAGTPGDGVGDAARQGPFSVPLKVREAKGTWHVIGHLDLALGGRVPSPQEIDMIEAIAERIGRALERAQLFQETQLRATRDQLAREAVENIRSAVTMEDAVRRAIREVGRTLGASEVVARIGPESELLPEGRRGGLAGEPSPGGDGHE